MKINMVNDTAVSPNLVEKYQKQVCVYPLTCKLNNGDLLCLYRQGTTKHSLDGVLIMQKSIDGGISWSDNITVYNGMSGDAPESVHTGALCQLADGSIIAIFTTVEVIQSDLYIFSEEGRKLRHRLCIVRSNDNGISWSTPEVLNLAGITYNVYVGSRPFLLPNGDLFVPLESTGSNGQQLTLGTVSDDGGYTFQPVTIIAEDRTGVLSYGDPKFTTLPDGRILVLMWTFITATEETIAVHCCLSSDNGQTWSSPASVGVRSQIMTPLSLGSQNIIAAGNVRTDFAGIRLWFSHNGGESWSTENPIQMWDAHTEKMSGAPLVPERGKSSGNPTEKIWDELPRYSFGAPDLVLLDDKTILLTYYAILEDVTHVRACRFKVVP